MFAPFHGEGPEPIGFLLAPKFSMMAFLSAVEPLRISNRLAARELFAWRAFSFDGAPVDASNGMRLIVEGSTASIAGIPTVLVCAGFEPERYATGPVLNGLRKLARSGVVLGALDTGTLILARANLLGDAAVTMHWEAVPAFREAFPQIRVTDALYHVDGGRITCAGGTAAMDLMLDMIASKHGETLALAMSEQLIHERIRNRADHQRMTGTRRPGPRNARVAKIISLMERHLDDPLGRDQLAAAGGISIRQLERLFRAHVGVTPANHYLDLRLTRARHLLRQTDMSVIEVATAAGFTSGSVLSRAYRTRFGVPPSSDRVEPTRWSLPLAVGPGT